MKAFKIAGFSLFIMLVFWTGMVAAQEKINPFRRLYFSGDVVGKVAACTIQPVIATVYIPGLSFVAKMSPTDDFRLLNVPPGVYDLAIDIPGLTGSGPRILNDIEVNSGLITDVGTINFCEDQCVDNSECDPGSYCEKAVGGCESFGNCKLKPEICTEEFAPVCGCDGKTYGTACEAASNGVNVVHAGACEVSACTDNECSADAYCAKPIGQCANEGSCQVRPEACITIFLPVCGCDGVTYSNACDAASAGVNVVHDGECQPAPQAQ